AANPGLVLGAQRKLVRGAVAAAEDDPLHVVAVGPLKAEPESILAHSGLVDHTGDDEVDGLDRVTDDPAKRKQPGLRLDMNHQKPVRPGRGDLSSTVRQYRVGDPVERDGNSLVRILVATETRQQEPAFGIVELDVEARQDAEAGDEVGGVPVRIVLRPTKSAVQFPDAPTSVPGETKPPGAGRER